jgi:hypothetical protein
VNVHSSSALAKGLVALTMAGAVGGGIAYTTVTAGAADRTAPTKAWKKAKDDRSEIDWDNPNTGRQDTALSKELLPVPDHFVLGPDIEEFGNDVHLSGAKAEALLAEGGEGLPDDARAEHRERVGELEVQGMAMRSYVQSSRQQDLLVVIRLAKMNKGAVEDRSAALSELAKSFSALREGPEIEGHDNASCFLLPEEEAEGGKMLGLEEMFCTAYEGDTLVSFSATWPETADADDAARLLKKQLDRLTEGGGISA